MLYCEKCCHIFDDYVEKRYRNNAGEEIDPPTYHCPECGSDFIDTVYQCEICEEWYSIGQMNVKVCDNCLADIEKKIKNLIFRHCTVMEVEAAKEHLDIGGIL